MSIQQLMLGVGASKKTYSNDVFSTYLWTGNGSTSTRTMANDIDFAGEGGMVWIVNRSQGNNDPKIVDTVRGLTGTNPYYLRPGSNAGQGDRAWNWSFLNNGFSFGADYSDINGNNHGMASWSFRKSPGFFTVKEYSGVDDTLTLSHDLGCVPGLILIKRTDTSANWQVYHRDLGNSTRLVLNGTAASQGGTNFLGFTSPTATTFTVGLTGGDETNVAGGEYIAYLFAGGESDAATARSVDFDGSNDYMTIPTHADLAMGTGDVTFEFWFNTDLLGTSKYIYDGRDGTSDNRIAFWFDSDNKINAYLNNTSRVSTTVLTKGQWYHIAWTRQGTTSRLFINGTQELSWSDSVDYAAPASNSYIGGLSSGYNVNGKVSNFRIVKGTAVYTSSFKPPTEPLTNVTNTKLLCCNNSSVTGSTVSPTTIANSGSTASTDSPFDDPAAFTFGENGDQGIIKCGSYVGNGSSTGPEVYLGWEPQWLLIKGAGNADSWILFDSMRGIVDGDGYDMGYRPNENAAEETDYSYLALTSTGFKLTVGQGRTNNNDVTYVYVAIRRPDGYVGKPAEAGTDVFAMDAGAGSSTIPNFDSGFPVDFAFEKTIAGGNSWSTGARLMQGRYLYTDTNIAAGEWDKMVFDSNTGWNNHSSYGSGDQSWMWKRHAGFDVVCYKGNGTAGHTIPHSLNAVPEMMWLKCRGQAETWIAYHKDLNGGTNPHTYFLQLSSDSGESAWDWTNGTAPTSTHFTLGTGASINFALQYIVMLFASVDGISKVGSYTGTGSEQTITTGFQPRFLIIKRTDSSSRWSVFDTTRGWSSGSNDAVLQLDVNTAQIAGGASADMGNPTSTGFVLKTASSHQNASGGKYIYYAHA